MSHIMSLLAVGCLAAAVATLNAKCPMMGNAVTAEGGTASFAGQTIGFCCDGCGPKFAKLSDIEKVAALAENGTTMPQ